MDLLLKKIRPVAAFVHSSLEDHFRDHSPTTWDAWEDYLVAEKLKEPGSRDLKRVMVAMNLVSIGGQFFRTEENAPTIKIASHEAKTIFYMAIGMVSF